MAPPPSDDKLATLLARYPAADEPAVLAALDRHGDHMGRASIDLAHQFPKARASDQSVSPSFATMELHTPSRSRVASEGSSLSPGASLPHIASPDAHVDKANQRIVMYYHGLDALASQVSRVAISSDGINFTALPEVLGAPTGGPLIGNCCVLPLAS